MEYRTLGHTQLRVSEIGFGGWQLCNDAAWGAMTPSTAHALISHALEAGINLFDTAPNYAAGGSESALGDALCGVRDQVVLVSKFGHTREGETDFSLPAFRASLEGSLARLQTDYLDLLLLHNPPAAMQAADHPIWDAMRGARERGRIRYFGASVDTPGDASAFAQTGCQVLEVLFNILQQQVRHAFPMLAERGIGIITKVPLDSGWLSGRYSADSRFEGIRSRWTPDEITRRSRLVDQLEWLTEDGSELAHHALAFNLSYPEVGCAIPGMRTHEHLRSNVAAAGRHLSTDTRQRLEHFWDTETGKGIHPLPW